jgi:hypothetical protein
MRRSDKHPALTEEVARFQDEVRRLALAAVRAIVEQELERRRAKAPPARTAPARRGAQASRQTSLPFFAPSAAPSSSSSAASSSAASSAQPAAAPSTGSDGAASAGTEAPGTSQAAPGSSQAAPGTPQAAPGTPAGNRKRVPWTREAIINELATWMLSGTAIDATFVQRYGPPGLVAAARRIFGRFDAALNVAGLHISKLYPDGPPNRNAS